MLVFGTACFPQALFLSYHYHFLLSKRLLYHPIPTKVLDECRRCDCNEGVDVATLAATLSQSLTQGQVMLVLAWLGVCVFNDKLTCVYACKYVCVRALVCMFEYINVRMYWYIHVIMI